MSEEVNRFISYPGEFTVVLPEKVSNAFCPTGPGGGQDNSCPPTKQGEGGGETVFGSFDSSFQPSYEYEFEPQEEFYAENVRDEDGEYTKALDAYTSESLRMNNFLRKGEDDTDEIARLEDDKLDLENAVSETEDKIEATEDEDELDRLEDEMKGYEEDLEHVEQELDDLNSFETNFDITVPDACDYLEELIHKSPPLADEVKVERGISGTFLQDVRPGDILTDDGFMSTTTSTKVAESFGWSKLQLTVPKGTTALFYPDRNEKELLFPQGTQVQVTGIKVWKGKDGGNRTIVQGKVVKR